MKIGIAGIGGIGSNVARHLAQAKIKHLKIVDYDRVEESNLNRQFYRVSQVGRQKTAALQENLKEIFPAIAIETLEKKIAPGEALEIFADCSVVVEGFDDKIMKKTMIEELSHTAIHIVSACGIAGISLENIGTRRLGNCQIIGDFTSDQEDNLLFPPKIGIIAATMAHAVLLQHREYNNA